MRFATEDELTQFFGEFVALHSKDGDISYAGPFRSGEELFVLFVVEPKLGWKR